MITDEADKWYWNPDIYQTFSESQDPENLCLRLAFKKLPTQKEIHDPIDLGSGTGKLAWFILENVPHKGILHCVDNSKQMIDYLEFRRRRESISAERVAIHPIAIEGIVQEFGKEASDLIVSNFAFPSKITDADKSLKELEAVYHCLRPGGYFITIGWDETFNDELSEMWYKYVPDNISARNFEEWRGKRVEQIKDRSARNCNLNWFKQGLRVPLEFVSVAAAAKVMGYLFGITVETKESIESILSNFHRMEKAKESKDVLNNGF
jgi:SAM-dependent methyltransferase